MHVRDAFLQRLGVPQKMLRGLSHLRGSRGLEGAALPSPSSPPLSLAPSPPPGPRKKRGSLCFRSW